MIPGSPVAHRITTQAHARVNRGTLFHRRQIAAIDGRLAMADQNRARGDNYRYAHLFRHRPALERSTSEAQLQE
ncbi:MAG: hypothetical protein HN428_01575 [Proteobacteria bacterium]|nr:hypothetical protein [Pseudomonadota bacterium]MBT5228183.1 hypothetical protein [Pseudomonadota bacterium]MBT6349024.1 hypothetical protein [Pseudomonadota bacterium]MCH1521737.1 hypothetical protein [Arenicellales bacterium]